MVLSFITRKFPLVMFTRSHTLFIVFMFYSYFGNGFYITSNRPSYKTNKFKPYGDSSELYSTNSPAYLTLTNATDGEKLPAYIEGASNVVLVQDDLTKTKRYTPESWASSDVRPEAMWSWLEEKRLSENLLQNAIASNVTDLQEHFYRYEQYLATEHADILQQNLNFFQFLNNNDVDGLRSLWLDSNDTVCVQPGHSGIVTGYRNIINWLVHSSSDSPHLLHAPKNVTLKYYGDMAIVSSVVDVTYASRVDSKEFSNNKNGAIISKRRTANTRNENKIGPYYCTNIFVKPPDTDTYVLSTHIGTPKLAFDSREAKLLRNIYKDPTSNKRRSSEGRDGNTRVISIQQLFNNRNKNGMNIFGSLSGGDDAEEEEEEENGNDEDDEYSDESEDDEDDEEDDEEIVMSDDDDDSDEEDDDEEIAIDEESSNRNLSSRRAQLLKSSMAKVLRRLGLDLPNSRGTKNVMVIDTGRTNRATNGDTTENSFTAKLIKSISDSIAKNEKLNAATAAARDDADEDEDDTEKGSSSKVKKELKKSNVTPVRRGGKSGYLIEDGEEEVDEDEDFDDESKDDEEVSKTAKILASQTLKAVKWLYSRKLISQAEKNVLTNDIIMSNARNDFSKVEIAFSLIIGPGKPEELLSAIAISSADFMSPDGNSVSNTKFSETNIQSLVNSYRKSSGIALTELDRVDEDVVTEFEDLCHSIASELML